MKVVEKNKMTNKKENENGLCTPIVEGRGRKFEKGNYLITSIQHRALFKSSNTALEAVIHNDCNISKSGNSNNDLCTEMRC